MKNTLVIEGIGQFDGGYFVLNERAVVSPLPKFGNLLITYPSQKSILSTLLKLVESAEKYLKVCSFVLESDMICKALQKKLQENVAVFVLTSVKDDTLKARLDFDEEIEGEGGHLDYIDLLTSRGAHVRACERAHSKFVIADGSSGLLMSANLTRLSFEQNPESGIMLAKGPELEHLEQLFDSIFQFGSEYVRFDRMGSNRQVIQKRVGKMAKEFLPDSKASSLRYTWESYQQNLLAQIEHIAGNAKKELLISTYSIVGVEKLDTLRNKINALVAQNSGTCTILSRGMNHRADHLMGCLALARAGAVIYGDLYNHSKGIIADGLHHLLFTANIDGYFGLTKGFEVGACLESNSALALEMETFIRWQISNAPFVFKVLASKKEVFASFRYLYENKKSAPLSLPRKATLIIREDTIPSNFQQKLKCNPLFVNYEGTDGGKRKYLLTTVGQSYWMQEHSKNEFEVVQTERYGSRNLGTIWEYETLELIWK